jgi:hypothetical protein
LCKSREYVAYDQCANSVNSLCATACMPDDGPCEIETCCIVVEGHEIGVIKPWTTHMAALKTVFVYIYSISKPVYCWWVLVSWLIVYTSLSVSRFCVCVCYSSLVYCMCGFSGLLFLNFQCSIFFGLIFICSYGLYYNYNVAHLPLLGSISFVIGMLIPFVYIIC